MVTTFKRLRNIAVGTALVLSSASAFADAAMFTINPGALGLSPITAPVTGNVLNGVSSAQVSSTGGFTYESVGYIQYTGLSVNSSTYNGLVSGLNTYYNLYATFTQQFACNAMLGAGTSCAVTGITLNLYADAGANDTYNAATTSSVASVTNTTGDILLGTVDTVIAGTAGVDPLAGAFQNVNTNLVLNSNGLQYFIAPTPFYSLAFSGFQNTSQGISCLPNCVSGITVLAINSETGVTDFNGVPEPMPLALMGLGMLGMVAFRRKQAK